MEQVTYSANHTQSILKAEFNDDEFTSLRELLASNDEEVVQLGIEMIKIKTNLNDLDIRWWLLWDHII